MKTTHSAGHLTDRLPVIAYLGVGSNLGDPVRNCRDALRELSSLKNIQVLRRSSLYRTEPVAGRW